MKLEDQCCSFDLAKKLKELGVKQESVFYWNLPFAESNKNATLDNYNDRYMPGFWCSAFTVAELGEMLPNYTEQYDYLHIQKTSYDWAVLYGLYGVKWDGEGICSPDVIEQESKEADARAKMLIHLIENGIVTP